MCPAKYFSGLPMLGRGNLVGGPPRRAGARRRRVVSLGRACRRRPQFTRVGRCRRGVTLRPVARARGAVRGGVGDGGWEPAIHGSYVFEFGLGSSHQGHRIGATTCLPSHGVAGGWCRGWERRWCRGWACIVLLGRKTYTLSGVYPERVEYMLHTLKEKNLLLPSSSWLRRAASTRTFSLACILSAFRW